MSTGTIKNGSAFQLAGRSAASCLPGRLLLLPFVLAAIGFGGPAGLTALAETGVSKEYQVKAAFLVNFVMFVEWPTSAFAEPNAPICIGVLGADPFGDALDEVARGGRIKGHAVVVKRFHRLGDVDACHLLFVSRSESGNVTQILAGLGPASILTVGETDGFCAAGGVINFFMERGRLRFEINTDAAGRYGLNISSKLLSLGKIIATAKGKEHE